MISTILQKNMVLKRNFMNKRFGLFKSLVYRNMQYNSFINVCNYLLTLHINADSVEKRLQICKDIYEYLLRTTDIWTNNKMERFVNVIKQKTFQFAEEFQIFEEYLIKFGWVCPYKKRNGEICKKKNNGLCKNHKACAERLKNRIIKELPKLPTDLCNIVYMYALPY